MRAVKMRKEYVALERRIEALHRKHHKLGQDLSNLRYQLEQTDEYRVLTAMVMELEPRIRRWFHLPTGWQPLRIDLGPIEEGDDAEWYLRIETDNGVWLEIPQSRFSVKIWNRCLARLEAISRQSWTEPKPLFRRVSDWKGPGPNRPKSRVLKMPKRSQGTM
ncbi:MAG: hypothetical protein A3J28_09375 [Acidobacteria bacterium RIFCSPLOWO2_12_FULL_60_22]|nr:MAG: hypothetical protein A3J28_09375 [Acidobacteria bacterium RIFCSPLOWO2_12_FULL_60_22]